VADPVELVEFLDPVELVELVEFLDSVELVDPVICAMSDPTDKQEGSRRAAGPQVVLGIDPGSTTTGYAVVHALAPGRTQYVECGVLRAERRAATPDRLVEIAGSLREVIDEYRPGCAAMEDVFFHRNARSALKLGQARGALLLVVAERCLPVYSYPPAVVKKAVAGRGRASKEQISRMVQALCKLSEPPESDASDALAVALCHSSAIWQRGLPRRRL
jgi:crossover junction endodeoxyribonuclease RuvC